MFRFCIFGSVGIAAEIFFRSITAFIAQIQDPALAVDYSLTSCTHLWMFPIYGLGAILIPLGYRFIENYSLLLRLLVYAIGIFIIEFITGFLLDMLIGYCPWEYKEGLHMMGYIRLDYLPFWMFYGWIMDYLHRKLSD